MRADEVPWALRSEFRNISNCRQALDERAIAILDRAKLSLSAIVPDGHASQMRGVRDDAQVAIIGSARLAIIDGEGAENCAVVPDDGCRPTGPQAMHLRQLTVVFPQRVRVDVGNHDQLFAIGSGAAGANLGPDLESIRRLTISKRKARASSVAQCDCIAIQKKNGTQQAILLLFDFSAESSQDIRKRGSGHDHGQDGFIQLRPDFRRTLRMR